jgi:hypothetical protein
MELHAPPAIPPQKESSVPAEEEAAWVLVEKKKHLLPQPGIEPRLPGVIIINTTVLSNTNAKFRDRPSV